MSSNAPKTNLPDRRAMLQTRPAVPVKKSTDPRPYWFGALGGLFSGLVGAYLFNRAAQEATKDGDIKPIETAQMFGLLMAIITVLRQVAELARPPQSKKK